MTLRIGSLCTGYGGLDLAVESVLGGEIAWVADSDPGAAAILAHRFPSVLNVADITVADWARQGPVDVLTAGFPCQDVSCAGGRAGLREGNRTGVWAHVARAINALRPSLVVLENVRGLLSAGADSDLEWCPWCLGDADPESALRAIGAVLGDLADLGFDADWVLVSASDVGAPHRRERVFILAWPTADSAGHESRGHDTVAGDPGWEKGERPGAGYRLSAAHAQCGGWHGLHERLEPGYLAPGAGIDGPGIRPGAAPGPAGSAEDADRTAGSERWVAAPGQTAPGGARADAGGPGGARTGFGPPCVPSVARGVGRSDGRDARWAESARLIGGPDAAECGDGSATDSDRDGRPAGLEYPARGGQIDRAGTSVDRAGRSSGGVAPDAHSGGRGPHEPGLCGGQPDTDRLAPPDPDSAPRGRLEPGTGPSPVQGPAVAERAPEQPGRRDSGGGGELAVDWRQFGPAIARWEHVLGRAAPRPTEPGRTGERLSPRFVEWMQGLPDGWVTDVPGLSRNAQLKALGNGVVPQQAAAALRLLLPAISEAAA